MTKFTFYNKKTEEYEVFDGSIAEAEAHEKKNPHLNWMAGTPLIHSGRGMGRIDQGFKEVLQKVKQAHPLGTVNTR